MPSADAPMFLWDAMQAADKVERFVAGKTFNDYLTDELLRSGVERQLAIVGEALAGLRRVDPALAQSIPELPRIVGFRNILIHNYADIDDRMVWRIIEADLIILRDAVGNLLKNFPLP